MRTTDTLTLGERLDHAVAEALLKWCRAHAKGRPYEEAFSADVKRVDVLAELNTHRRSTVFVSIIGRRPWTTESYDMQLPGPLRPSRLPWERD